MNDISHCGAEPSSISSAHLAGARELNPAAWSRLVDRYGPVIYGWCRREGVTREDAFDLVQEVFAAIALHISGFRRDRPGDSFTAWLRAITRNMVCDHFRARRGRPAARGGSTAQRQMLEVPDVPSESADAGSSESPRGVEMPIELERVRSEFEPRTWEAFHRAVIRRQRPVRIAQELGMSVPAVYQAKSRVLRRLRREFQGPSES